MTTTIASEQTPTSSTEDQRELQQRAREFVEEC